MDDSPVQFGRWVHALQHQAGLPSLMAYFLAKRLCQRSSPEQNFNLPTIAQLTAPHSNPAAFFPAWCEFYVKISNPSDAFKPLKRGEDRIHFSLDPKYLGEALTSILVDVVQELGWRLKTEGNRLVVESPPIVYFLNLPQLAGQEGLWLVPEQDIQINFHHVLGNQNSPNKKEFEITISAPMEMYAQPPLRLLTKTENDDNLYEFSYHSNEEDSSSQDRHRHIQLVAPPGTDFGFLLYSIRRKPHPHPRLLAPPTVYDRFSERYGGVLLVETRDE